MLFVNTAYHLFCQIRALTAEGSTKQGRIFCGEELQAWVRILLNLLRWY